MTGVHAAGGDASTPKPTAKGTVSTPSATESMGCVQASELVIETAGGTWESSLNHFDSGGGCMVTAQQVDEHVYVIGQEEFDVAHYSLAGWLNEVDQADPPVIACDGAADAWAVLKHLRHECLIWQCGACDAFLFTSNRPRIGVLRCSTCGVGGVDFRHADRHVGGDID